MISGSLIRPIHHQELIQHPFGAENTHPRIDTDQERLVQKGQDDQHHECWPPFRVRHLRHAVGDGITRQAASAHGTDSECDAQS